MTAGADRRRDRGGKIRAVAFLLRWHPYAARRAMIPNLLQLITRRPPSDYDRGFVEEVRLIESVPPRNPRVEKLILVCWLLIAVKCWLVVWLVDKYHMKLDPLWVNAPTVAFALMCTAVYFWRD